MYVITDWMQRWEVSQRHYKFESQISGLEISLQFEVIIETTRINKMICEKWGEERMKLKPNTNKRMGRKGSSKRET